MAVDLSISNPRPRKLPGPQLLHELVPHQGKDGAVAIDYAAEDGSLLGLQYNDLHTRADALARRIAQARKPSTTTHERFIVPLLIPQCPELYISQLAILKAGGAFCPLVSDVPEERLRFILADVDAHILLTTASLKSRLPSLKDITVIAVDERDDRINNKNDATPLGVRSPSPQDPAYVMYTSGSTGQPKGVVLSHSAATQALLAHDSHIPSFSRFLQFASPTFDVSVFEIFFPWLRQATLVSCDRRRLLNDLPAAINDLNVDACELTPSVASSLLRQRGNVPSLKVLLTIGEMLKPSVTREFGGNAEDVAILHGMYGPTEATIHCTLQTFFPQEMSCGTIGIPFETVSCFIVDTNESNDDTPSTLSILPRGEEGELAIGGYQLADGYLNREEQTKAAFVKHPQFGMLYRTGDRAKMLPDGKLECFGRISNGQVKLRGQRVELGEIEYAASKTPGCLDVVAEVIAGILIIFCVCKDEATDERSILENCQKWLPAFMVPGDVILLDSLPYLSSGKCDRKSLRLQYEQSQSVTRPGSKNQSAHEERICLVIGRVLNADVTSNSMLPGIGLDSLSAIRIASELRKAGFAQLDASDILAARTPSQICSSLEKTTKPKAASDFTTEAEKLYRKSLDQAIATSIPAHLASDVLTTFPCTAVQTAMLSETSKDAFAYCNWVEFHLPEASNLDVLTRAIHQLAEIHPLLRSGFTPVTGTSWSYAVVVWNNLLSSQVVTTSKFNLNFQLSNEQDMLRPCRFQLRAIDGGGSRLLVMIHHALYDQWTIDIFRTDLCHLLRGKHFSHPTFKTVADYHIHHASEATSSSVIEFWQEQLRDVAPISIPLLRGQEIHPGLRRSEWKELSLRTNSLRTAARDIGCSNPSLFQSALIFLLGQLAGVSDVTFGTVFSGRTLPIDGIDRVFGPCLATLPLRMDYSTAFSCRDLLKAITDQNRALQSHVLTSPTVIREAAGIAPGTSLFDTLFIWQESTMGSQDGTNEVKLVDSKDQQEFNLVLEFEPSSTTIRTRATYQQSLTSALQIDILLRQMDILASAILSNPDQPVQDLVSNLSADLLSISNPQPSLLAASFELTTKIQQRALEHPSATAILFADSLDTGNMKMLSMSYAELNAKANCVSHALLASGLAPGDLVCICMEKCIDLYVTMLAVLKAGAGYLPLVPETPEPRIQSVLGQAKIKLSVCDSKTFTTFQRLTDAAILDVTKIKIADFRTSEPRILHCGSRTSYAVFTSGSTGEPKGVAVTMDNLKGNLAVLSELYETCPGDRLLQACSQAFDVSVFEIFFAFYTGMCLCSATKEVMFRDFEHSIRTLGATHLSLTPTVAALVQPENVPNVRFLVTAGEGITDNVHRRWAESGLHQGYGPSETTNICSIKMNVSKNDVLGNIGAPFRNTSAFVLAPQEDFCILPAGAYGEFAFGGEQVFRGYIGRDDLNSTKIINHPKYGRLYRSGDMGRILYDGTLLIAGRLDDQVKIRGNRVELGEINAVVSDHTQVSDCATIVLGDSSAEQVLATFCVLSATKTTPDAPIAITDPMSTTISQIFDLLESSLPSYMVPSLLLPLNRLPITTQGKLDKRLLKSLTEDLDGPTRDQFARAHESSSQDMPSNPTERAIAEALTEVIGTTTARIGRHSSFLALGLNSLNAIHFAKLLESKIAIKIGIAAVLRNPTTARLGRVLSENHKEQSRLTRDLISRSLEENITASLAARGVVVDMVLPCTPLQEAMLSASEADGAAAYCNTTKLCFSGDMNHLQTCWNELTRRHSILRTFFMETLKGSNPYVQVVLKDPPETWFSIESFPVSNGPRHMTNGNCNGHSPSPKPTLLNGNVTPGSPLRVDVDGPDVFLHMHHAIYDGIALTKLFDELETLFNREMLPQPSAFEPFLREVVAQNGEDALKFWAERMQHFQPHPFLVGDISNARDENVLERTISVDPAEVKSFSERHLCTSLAIFQAALVKTLACAQDLTDVCFGNVVSGRSVPVPDVDRLVAPCFNTIPIRSKLETLRTNLDLVLDLHQTNLETLPFQLTATRRVQLFSRRPSSKLFETVLLVQPPQYQSSLWSMEEESMDMGIPLVLEMVPEDSSYAMNLHYMQNRISDVVATNFADAFASSLVSCLRYSSSPTTHFMDFDHRKIASKLLPVLLEDGQTDDSHFREVSGLHDRNWNREEDKIRHIFARIADVDIERLDRNTSLYQIGLDSLNAIQVASELRGLGFKVDAADVMQYQTPAALGLFLGTTIQTAAPNKQDSYTNFEAFDKRCRPAVGKDIDVDQIEAIRPCTPAQSGMLAQFIQSQGAYYVGHLAYAIPNRYGAEDIENAWTQVRQKHQVLRMGFQHTEDASLPFNMLIYHATISFDSIFAVLENEEEIHVNGTHVARSMLEQLHLPAWRVTLHLSSTRRIMRLDMHHALYDAQSLQTLLGDFWKALHSEELGPILNIDQVLSEQLEGASMQKKESETFWTAAFDLVQLLKFPNLTPNIVSMPQAKSSMVHSKVVPQSLDSFCADQSITIQALGQTVWAILLAAYVGEPVVTFGTVFAGFSTRSESVAFPTISTVPVCCQTDKPVVDVIKDMVTYNAAAQRHRFASLTDIQRYAGSARHALFDTVFVYQKAGGDTSNTFDWQPVNASLGIDFVASMELEASSQGKIALRLTHDTSCIPDAHGLLLLQQYDMILGQIISGKEPRGLPDPKLLSHTAPQQAILPCPVKLLHQFVEQGAKKYEHKPALEFITNLQGHQKARRSWTYMQLNERGNQVAHLLLRNGVQPGGMVAVCMSKSAEASFAFLGILKAGCSFLAMDPELPLARRRFIIEDSRSRLLFVDPGKKDSDLDDVVCTIELEESGLVRLPSSSVQVSAIDSSARSYCLYTSGTTGTPKGCELSHDNAVQAMMSFQKLFSGHWTKTSRWLQFASYWFDVSVLEQFWSWSVGITVISAPRDVVLEDLAGFIREANITHIDLTPSLARLLTPEEVPSLWNNVFITGGEALKQEIIDAWGPYKTICNGYGPTEATIGVTMNPFIGTDAKPSNIGPAFDNVGTYVFEPGTDELVLRGAVGELCVSGKLVGKGYLNRPDLTEKSFPFLKKYGERVYRTGDLVRLLADGSVSFIGRKDTQAKLRGQRLEIDEIDSVIKSSTSAISDVASLVTKSEDGSREALVSFIVPTGTKTRELRVINSRQGGQLVQAANEACQTHLPGYMVPTHIIPVSNLPLTVNNKVDTKQFVTLFTSLSAQELQQMKGQNEDSRALYPAEHQIAKTLGRLLSISTEEMGPSSNIFSLGLSSVSAINFVSMLRRGNFPGASVAAVMKNSTLERLARALTDDSKERQDEGSIRQSKLRLSAFAQRYRSMAAESLSVQVSDVESVAPCTPLQEGLLTESLKGSNRPYFNHFWYDITELDDRRVQDAVEALYQQTAILRTVFLRADEGFLQVTLTRQTCPLETIACESSDVEKYLLKRKHEWASGTQQEVTRPFESVILTSPNKTILAMHAHHGIYDGVSWNLTLEKLAIMYKQDHTSSSGPSFFDTLAYGPLFQQTGQEAFWKQTLGTAQFSSIPKPSDKTDASGKLIQATITKGEALETVRKQLGISHQAVIQSAFVVALHQLSPNTECYGVVLSGRSINFKDSDQVIGPMFNTVPFTVNLQPSDTWAHQVQRTQQQNAEVLPFQHTPLRSIKKYCGRSPSDPMFDVLFVFQRPAGAVSSKVDSLFKPMEAHIPAEYPIAFEVELSRTGEIMVTVGAQSEYANEAFLLGLVENFEKAFDSMVEDANQQISTNFSVTRSASAPVQNGWDNTTETPQANGVHDFSWTAEANTIRTFVAQLVGCDEESVTEHTTIFTLGLDSIDAIKLASRLKKAGLSIAVSKILEAQTIPKISQAITAQEPIVPSKSASTRLSVLETQLQGLEHEKTERVLPATPGQEGLIADMMRSELQDYYNSDVLRLHKNTDMEKLKQAWQSVVDASPILRTSFVEVTDPNIDAVYAQVVHHKSGLEFGEATFDKSGGLNQYLEQMRNEVARSSSKRSPLRLAFATMGSDTYLVLSLAHAQYDGHSLALLHQDVSRAYYGSLQPRPLYDVAIEDALNATSEGALSFWRNTLMGVKVSGLDYSMDASNTKTHRAERTSSTSSEAARFVCKKLGVTMQALAEACWAVVLAYLCNGVEITFGVVLACRDSEDAEALMFPTMNTVPVRVGLHGTSRELIRHVQGIMNDIRPYQKTPLRSIQVACSKAMHETLPLRSGALFDTLFTYQHRPKDSGEQVEPLYESVDGNSNVEYPIAAEVEAVGKDLILRVAAKDYALDKRDTIDLLKKFDHVLDFLISSPDETTVAFSGNRVSICTLPSFELRDEDKTPESVGSDTDDSQEIETEDADVGNIAAIRSALAQVSKVPAEEIASTSTIESIGVDSISAIKVAALLRKQSIKLSVSEILHARTPRRMAEVVEAKTASPTPTGVPALETIADALRHIDIPAVLGRSKVDGEEVELVMPATSGQQYMFAMWQQTGGELFYPTFHYRARTDKTTDDIRSAWEQVVARNGILRTVFVSGNSTIPMLQIRLKPSAGASQKNLEHVQPLVRLHITEEPRGSYALALKIHHALYDAVSLPLIFQELQDSLNGIEPPMPKASFPDYVALNVANETHQRRKEFWTQYLQDVRSKRLPPTKADSRSKVEMFKPAAFAPCNELEQCARSAHVTVQAILFAVYAKLYAQRAVGENNSNGDVVFGVYIANRSHFPELDALAAPTLNLLPLLVRSAHEGEVMEMAKKIDVDLRVIGSAENSTASLAEIASWTGVRLDSFVNFLKLPEQSEKTGSQKDGFAVVEEVNDEWREERGRVYDLPGGDFAVPEEMAGFEPGDAYQNVVDVEFSMAKGELSIGIFCREDLLSLEDAEAVAEAFKSELGKFVV